MHCRHIALEGRRDKHFGWKLWRTRALGQNEPLCRADSRDKAVLPECEHSENRLLQERLKTACYPVNVRKVRRSLVVAGRLLPLRSCDYKKRPRFVSMFSLGLRDVHNRTVMFPLK